MSMDERVEWMEPPPPRRRSGSVHPTIAVLLSAAESRPGEWASIAVPSREEFKRISTLLYQYKSRAGKKNKQVEVASRSLNGTWRVYAKHPKREER